MFKATLSFITASSVGPSGMIQTYLENPAAAWKSIKFIHSHSIHFQTGASPSAQWSASSPRDGWCGSGGPSTSHDVFNHWALGPRRGVSMEVAGLKAFNIHSIPEFVQLHLIESGRLIFFFPACTVDACRVTPSVFISFSHCSFFHLAEIATRCGYTRYVLISGEDQMIPPTDWWCKTMAQCSLGQHQEHQGVQLPATKLIKYCSLFFLTQP